MIAIDADSHFATKVTLVDAPPRLTPEVTKLVEKGHLSFGHWEIGDRHDPFVVLLRAMPDVERAAVFSKLKDACDVAFDKTVPDLVIFPGDSTAIHLASRFATDLGVDGKLVVASPAFRAYGRHLLRLEIPPDSLSSLRRKKRVNILFFDDSLSSGETECHVLEAFGRERKHLDGGVKIRWLSFTVLWRGQRWLGNIRVPTREKPKLAELQKIAYHFDSFGIIGPESLGLADCPLCRASRHIRSAVEWARGARPAVRQLLEQLDEVVQARPIERLISPLSYIDLRITHELLRLASMPMPEACIYICRFFLQENPADRSMEERLAAILFCTLYHTDVGSYLAWQDTIRLIVATAKDLDLEQQQQRVAFLIALTALPASAVESVAPIVVSDFALRGFVDIAATVMAIAFALQHTTLLESTPRQGLELRRQVLSDHRVELIQSVKAALGKSPTGESNNFGSQREIIITDLNTVSRAPREENPAWVARTLSALLHKGKHPSFLSEQIDDLSSETVGSVCDGLLQALELMRRLPASAVEHLEKRMSELIVQIQKCADNDVDQCRELAITVMDEFWRRNLHQNFFLHPRVLDRELRRLTIEPVKKYHKTGIRTEHFYILECDESIMSWEAFGPSLAVVTALFTNLLLNPVKHFPLESLKVSAADPPVAVGYVKLNDTTEELLVIIADRARPPEREKLFGLSHGLANHRAYLQVFGGNLEYVEAAKGFFESNKAPTDRQKQQFSAGGWDPSLYKNLFVTTFPLVLKGT